ncbi:TatD family hydrolase [Campylobacter sp. US33a]|uniref:TatD family hydrolase n=1 Tax=Campylobacter sp. US33a TaxID=2498120 RepID=UPI001068C53F|nr:TatD family hydrolase [Campylobacter sp. US33a]TEY01174.1 TatD family deoxyribonuclease [Campylobacter sp. US33a]
MFLGLDYKNSESIIDTHCHLDDESYFGDLDEIIKHSKQNKIEKIIIPGADLSHLSRAREISYKYDYVYFAAGVHPYHCDEFDLEYLKKYSYDEKCVAIGECGLDYFYLKSENESVKQKQKEIFNIQLELARDTRKPVIIHSRDANDDTYQILKKYAKDLKGGVIHCFNASEHLLRLSDEGFYFGIGGVLTFKNAKNLVEILPKIPKDKLLLETDAPYLTPTPFRGKRNHPILTHLVVDKMSEILNIDRQELIQICTKNANDLFFQGVK